MGCSCMVVGHSDDGKKTCIRLPSGSRKTVPSKCRAVIGICAGGGRMDKPILKAGRNFHKYRGKRAPGGRLASLPHAAQVSFVEARGRTSEWAQRASGSCASSEIREAVAPLGQVGRAWPPRA